MSKHWEALPDNIFTTKIEHAHAILTPERIRLVNYVRDYGPMGSLQELADALGRDKAAVSRDVSSLNGSLLEEEKVGRRKRIRATDALVILY